MSSDQYTDNHEDRGSNYIDYNELTFRKAKVKFYNRDRGFGFVTLLEDDEKPTSQDAFLPGTKLEQAGYTEIRPGQIIQVKHTLRTKGEAVVLVKHPPGYTSPEVDLAPIKIKPRSKIKEEREQREARRRGNTEENMQSAYENQGQNSSVESEEEDDFSDDANADSSENRDSAAA